MPSLEYMIAFVGAGIGGVLRHGANVVTVRLLDSGFPYGTLFINVAGSFMMGLLAGLFTAIVPHHRYPRWFHDIFHLCA